MLDNRFAKKLGQVTEITGWESTQSILISYR